MTSQPPSLVARQRGRLWLLGVMLAAAGCLMSATTWVERVTGLSTTAVNLGGLLLGIVAFISAHLLLRCPSCGHSLFWHAISKHPFGQWLNWLLDVRECPLCGYTAQEPPNQSISTP